MNNLGNMPTAGLVVMIIIRLMKTRRLKTVS